MTLTSPISTTESTRSSGITAPPTVTTTEATVTEMTAWQAKRSNPPEV